VTVAWEVERFAETPAAFHARELPGEPVRAVWVCEASGPAVVLGSAQADEVVDHEACAQAGIDVVRRRSGGGAVLVVPGDLLWADVVVPAADPLWEVDVGRAFLWLGEAWAGALAELGVSAVVHGAGLLATRWSSLVCFAGTGSGEVLSTDGAKLVGLAQRRTRAAARFQCAALLRWDPVTLVELLALAPDDRAEARAALSGAAAGIPVPPDDLLAAFLRHLPA
jgi:lipoate-protein ligase A